MQPSTAAIDADRGRSISAVALRGRLGAVFPAQVHRRARAVEAWRSTTPEQRALLERRSTAPPTRCASCAALIEPVMPASPAGIRRDARRAARVVGAGLQPGTLAPGTRLGPIEPLFPRMEKTLEELAA